MSGRGASALLIAAGFGTLPLLVATTLPGFTFLIVQDSGRSAQE